MFTSVHRRRRWGEGAGGHCTPPPKKKNCQCKNSGKFQAKFGQNSGKIQVNSSSFNLFGSIQAFLSIYLFLARHSYSLAQRGFSALAGIRVVDSGFGQNGPKMCVPPKNDLVPYAYVSMYGTVQWAPLTGDHPTINRSFFQAKRCSVFTWKLVFCHQN